MRLAFQLFKGQIPKLDPRVLPDSAAQTAINCDTASGALEPLRADTQAESGAGIADFYNHDGTFLTFSARTSVAPGPVATDRLYIMASGEDPIMKVMPVGTEYPLAVPTPTQPATVAIETAADPNEPTYQTDDLGDPVLDPNTGEPIVLVEAAPLPVDTMVFVYTWVTIFDEEGLPGPVSVPLDVTEGSTVRLTMTDDPPVGTRVDRKRIYRSITSASGTTDYFFIKELNATTDAYVYDPAVDLAQNVLPSTFYDPPVSGLEGLTPMNNGMMAAFKGRDLYFCAPFEPHAWPVAYSLKTDWDIVGLAAFGNALAVLTEGQPYIVNGTAPENMIMDRLEINAPCLSAASIVDMGYSALFATNDGLASISAGGSEIITRNLFTRRQWRAMEPQNMSAGHYDGSYVFTYTDGGSPKTGLIDFNDGPHFVETDAAAVTLRHDLRSGDLYYAKSDGIYEFDVPTGAPRALTWRSKLIDVLSATPFAVLRVEGTALGSDAGDTAFAAKVFKDGVLWHTITALNSPERLPAGLGTTFELQIEGKVKITRAIMAGSVEELMG